MSDGTFGQRYFELSNKDPYIASVTRPGQTLVRRMPYSYNVNIGAQPGQPALTLAAGPVVSQLAMLADSDFVARGISAGVNLTANSDMKYNRNLTLWIQDTQTGKYWWNVPTVFALVAGGGGFPFIFPAPRVIRPNAILNVTGQNRDTGQDYNTMFVTLHGTRMFYAEDGNSA